MLYFIIIMCILREICYGVTYVTDYKKKKYSMFCVVKWFILYRSENCNLWFLKLESHKRHGWCKCFSFLHVLLKRGIYTS